MISNTKNQLAGCNNGGNIGNNQLVVRKQQRQPAATKTAFTRKVATKQ